MEGKRRLPPPSPPAMPRHRLPVGRRAFWAGIAVGLGVSAGLLTLTFTHRAAGPAADAPWGPDVANLRHRLHSLGLPVLRLEGVVLHIHQHLDLYLDGKHVAVPAGIGIGKDAGGVFFSPLHTHDRTGILHVESSTARPYSLGEFFGVWGVRLSATCIGGYCAAGNRKIFTFVDGVPFGGDPAQIPLRSHEEIVLSFGTAAQLPKKVPSSYSFPAGY